MISQFFNTYKRNLAKHISQFVMDNGHRKYFQIKQN